MIGQTISQYKVIENLGSGGMGIVYKAQDTKLDRFVALKFLPPELIREEDTKNRFIQEAKAAAALNHPNICTIYEINEFEEQSFIAMEYIEGQTLKDKINSEQLNVTAAVEIAIQIGEGLKKAHEKNIIHRDIKSANIMINEADQVKILDFGLAKFMGQVGLTKTQSTMGTVAYMSPEQARGENVDFRTDIWSFGIVLYEMLTGQLPFLGEYEQAVIYSILNEKPKPPSQLRSDIPIIIENIILKTLEKNKENRYKNFQALLNELKSPLNITVEKVESEISIIVLPFVNMSPDPDQGYFSDGLTEEIITDLSHIHDLLVISRSSAMTFKGTKKKIKEIAREVNVQYVLEGSVRKAGNNLRITAQLIDATTDVHLWADKYMGTLDDIFDIQEKVSRAIVDALKVKLTKKESSQIAERPIDNLQAYELYLKARQEIWKWTEDGLERALQYLQNGLNVIGDYSLFYFGIGYVYWTGINIGFQSKEDCLVNAERYAKKILHMDSDSPHGHQLIGLIHLRAANLQLGVIHLKQALEANPNDPDALHWLCIGYLNAGKTNAARPLIDRLLKIDPLTPSNYYIPGWFQLIEGQFKQALNTLYQAYRMDPKNPIHRFCYALALAYNDQFEEAYALFDAHINDSPEHLWAQMGHCLKYALLRENEKVTELMSGGLKRKARCDVFDSWVNAACDALIGEKEEALDSLEMAVNLGAIYYPFLNNYDPFLENLRGEERFKNLMERVKYEWENFEV